MEQELLTLPEHLGSSPVFSRVRVAQSLVFVDMFVGRDANLSFAIFQVANDR